MYSVIEMHDIRQFQDLLARDIGASLDKKCDMVWPNHDDTGLCIQLY